jgi:hypothetical protein
MRYDAIAFAQLGDPASGREQRAAIGYTSGGMDKDAAEDGIISFSQQASAQGTTTPDAMAQPCAWIVLGKRGERGFDGVSPRYLSV